MKKLISVLLALILLIGALPAAALSPAEAAGRAYGSVPILIGDPETDLMADRILAGIDTAGLSDRDKIQKVYDWIIVHCQRDREGLEYDWIEGPSGAEIAAYSKQMLQRVDAGQAVLRKELAQIYTDYPCEEAWIFDHSYLDSNSFVADCGNYMMHTYVGSCVHFSSLFAILLGHLGYDARMISGAFINSSGPTAHTWNFVLVGNKYYWFDIRIDHASTQSSSAIAHNFFMKGSSDEWARKHIWARGYTDLLENHTAAIRALYETDDAHTHQWTIIDWESTARCETVGFWVRECEICGIRSVDYLALGHDWEIVRDIAPTCTEEGFRSSYCTRCYESLFETIPATGHSWQIDQILAPGEDGEHGTASYLCGVCGAEKTARLCASEIFTDAPAEGNWAHSGVDYCVIRGLMNGTSPTLFTPGGTMTRAMVVQILWAAEDRPEPAALSDFSDVRPGAWYAKAVAWAEETGLVSGVGDGKFAPNKTLTRQELAVILRHYAEYREMDTEAWADLSAYPDVGSVSGWALTAMEWAVGAGVLSGASSPEGVILAPKRPVTRAMAAVMLMRFLTAPETE